MMTVLSMILSAVSIFFSGMTLGYRLRKIEEQKEKAKKVKTIFAGDNVSWVAGNCARKGKFIRWQNGFAVVHDTHGNVEYVSPTLHELKKEE